MTPLRPLIGMLSCILTAACVAAPPPSSAGAALFNKADFVGAYAELAPLAERGDPIAQYYVARMALAGVSPTPMEAERAIERLVSSASNGLGDAFGLLLLLRMTPEERGAFRRIVGTKTGADFKLLEGVLPDGTVYSSAPEFLSEEGYIVVEQTAGGPVSLDVIAAVTEQIDEFQNWPQASTKVRPSDARMLHVDETLAERGDKYAQARLGNRYATGRGVEQDLKQAFRWRLKAARTTPAPRSCVYQAPVGGGAGSTYCYDAGAPVSGLGAAMIEVCRAYADGAGVAQNPREAEKWCRRAAKQPRWKSQADAILKTLSS